MFYMYTNRGPKWLSGTSTSLPVVSWRHEGDRIQESDVIDDESKSAFDPTEYSDMSLLGEWNNAEYPDNSTG